MSLLPPWDQLGGFGESQELLVEKVAPRRVARPAPPGLDELKEVPRPKEVVVGLIAVDERCCAVRYVEGVGQRKPDAAHGNADKTEKIIAVRAVDHPEMM